MSSENSFLKDNVLKELKPRTWLFRHEPERLSLVPWESYKGMVLRTESCISLKKTLIIKKQ